MRAGVVVALVATVLAGCATSFTTPAAVRLDKGDILVGTTTAALKGGSFEVSDAKTGLRCSGTYDALDTSKELSAPFSCSDGRVGTLTVRRSSDGLSGNGTLRATDGTTGTVAFGREATWVINSSPFDQRVTAPQAPVASAPPRPLTPATSSAAEVIVDQWRDCAVAETEHLYSSAAAASELAVAALSACYRHEARLHAQLRRDGFTGTDRLVDPVRKIIQDRIILIVLEARKPRPAPARPPAAPKPSAPPVDERSI